jgi:hypothetical protein
MGKEHFEEGLWTVTEQGVCLEDRSDQQLEELYKPPIWLWILKGKTGIIGTHG